MWVSCFGFLHWEKGSGCKISQGHFHLLQNISLQISQLHVHVLKLGLCFSAQQRVKAGLHPPKWAYSILWCPNSRVRKTPWRTRKSSFVEGRELLLPQAPSSAVTAQRWKMAAELFQINVPFKFTWCEFLSGLALNKFTFPLSSVILANRDAAAKWDL